MKYLLYQELLIQNKIYNLSKYIILYFAFCISCIALVNSHDDIDKFGAIFSLISIPLSFIGLSNNLIKDDIDDGTLEYLLTSISPLEIVLAKFIIMSAVTSFSFILITPLLYIVFNLEFLNIIVLLASGLILILLCSGLVMLIASVQGYFRSNTNFFAILIMPLILPNVILSGIILENPQELYILPIMIGINLVILPPSIYLSSYLIHNIYNI